MKKTHQIENLNSNCIQQAQQLPLLEAHHGLKTTQTARHPVEHIQKNVREHDSITWGPLSCTRGLTRTFFVFCDRFQYLHTEQELKYNAMANVFGSHMVIRHELEKQILGSFQRLPALRSEFCALETITGRDTEMTFGDVFGGTIFVSVTHFHDLLPKYSVFKNASGGHKKYFFFFFVFSLLSSVWSSSRRTRFP
jgi:hypothetical protein